MSEVLPEPTINSTLPLSGAMIQALLSAFCQRPAGGDDAWPTCSVGVATDSVVASDGLSAVVIGNDAPLYQATQFREAVLEAQRSKLYGLPVSIDTMPRLADKSGEVMAMPNIIGLIRDRHRTMSSVAKLDPKNLKKIATLAIAAGADSVELLQPSEGDKTNAIGFRFEFAPDDEHVTLFNQWSGTIAVRGVVIAEEATAAAARSEELDLDEPAEVAPKKRGRPRKDPEVAAVADEAPVAPPKLEVIESFDLDAVIERGDWRLPPMSLLKDYPMEIGDGEHSAAVVRVLANFGIAAKVDRAEIGPTVSLYEVVVPPKVKVGDVAKRIDDLQAQLAARSIRIQAPIPGKNAIGIELPNSEPQTVGLRRVFARSEFVNSAPLTLGIGVATSGAPIYADLRKMPHLLVAGATNSGKSIGVASMISSILMRHTPDEVRMVMIDPKRVELSLFDGIPHLLCPVVKDVKEAPGVLRAIWREMDIRYDMLSQRGVRNIDGWNEKASFAEKLPYIVVIIDELADMMIQAKAEVETSIVRLAQLARAVGIHLVIATQRPSVDVITGLIKANVPSRIGFACASAIDSKVILDSTGAERLLGRGDMIFSPVGGTPLRVQGGYIAEAEIEEVVNWWVRQERIVDPMFGSHPHLVDVLADDFRSIIDDENLTQFGIATIQKALTCGVVTARLVAERLESLKAVTREGKVWVVR